MNALYFFVSTVPLHPRTYWIHLLNSRIGTYELSRFLLFPLCVHRSHVTSKRNDFAATISQYGSEVRSLHLPGNLDKRVRYLSLHYEASGNSAGCLLEYYHRFVYRLRWSVSTVTQRWIVNRRVTCRSVIPWRFQILQFMRAVLFYRTVLA